MKNVCVFAVLTFFCITIACAETESSSLYEMEASLGRLILLNDRKTTYQEDDNSMANIETLLSLEREYESHIKKLPEKIRVVYFWSTIWHFDFQGDYRERHVELIFKDCRAPFEKRLRAYLKKEKELLRDTNKLLRARHILAILESLEYAERHKSGADHD